MGDKKDTGGHLPLYLFNPGKLVSAYLVLLAAGTMIGLGVTVMAGMAPEGASPDEVVQSLRLVVVQCLLFIVLLCALLAATTPKEFFRRQVQRREALTPQLAGIVAALQSAAVPAAANDAEMPARKARRSARR